MSTLPMFRKCVHCGKRYTYNPSVGKFGLVCPKCGKVNPITPQHPELEKKTGDGK